jgi:hypothetical protein
MPSSTSRSGSLSPFCAVSIIRLASKARVEGGTAIFRKRASRRLELGPGIVKCRRQNRGELWRDVFLLDERS